MADEYITEILQTLPMSIFMSKSKEAGINRYDFLILMALKECSKGKYMEIVKSFGQIPTKRNFDQMKQMKENFEKSGRLAEEISRLEKKFKGLATKGVPKLDYDLAIVRELLNKKDTEELKKYINGYFFKVDAPPSVAYWKPTDDQFILLSNAEIRDHYILSSHRVAEIDDQGGKQRSVVKFCLQTYFFHDVTDRYNITLDPHESKLFEKNGIKYLNIAPSYVLDRTKCRPFKTYSQQTKEYVYRILDHFKNANCGRNLTQYHYYLQWLAHAICGVRKMKTIIYMRSLQGTGKSMPFECFIIPYIMGFGLSHMTADMRCVTGEFNAELKGKILLLLEEVPAETAGHWLSFSNKLKHLSTGHRLVINEKHKNPINVPNLLNILIFTNNNAVRLETSDRRYVPFDISTEFIGNVEYFNRLSQAFQHPESAEAFYSYLKEAVDPNYNEMILPVTNTKVDMLNENLHPAYDFLKTEYIKLNKGIDCSFTDFHTAYTEHAQDFKTSKIALSKLLKAIEIYIFKKKVSNTVVTWVNCPYDVLFKIFERKHFIHELDEIDPLPISDFDQLKELHDEAKQSYLEHLIMSEII